VVHGFETSRYLGETAIIDLAGYVALVLPIMLVIAAAMSQFSVATTHQSDDSESV